MERLTASSRQHPQRTSEVIEYDFKEIERLEARNTTPFLTTILFCAARFSRSNLDYELKETRSASMRKLHD
jgi:hypothetical protein